MLIKAVSLFLVFIAVLAIFGKLRVPGVGRIASRKCDRCGRYRIGKGPCDCGRS
ncbi:hypothetical protein SAMN05216257_104188 [Meinhardsimonia xiamenensis]|jgi:hypothetical protein|uniref:Uncharacterized protein n=1 Tax=Meinhardsimonia xiamenensis TaxID=990712 RepID=A0A1G9E836_9RHOB|nr:hypothetical protein [Meinhardsimonia xiamenensis]PRX33890.1 hypothetical protein LV81_02326 [Meinhardsimonia xiamenensis]SDK72215.1 hypothetical protein SAMN05216257_104188 [Meinhardsimonia xiamenensis]